MFICNRCGLCCKNIDKIAELSEFDNGFGRCIHLNDYNLCNIYTHRPNICNVDKMFDLFYSRHMRREEYDRMNMDGCRKLKENKEENYV